MKNVLKVIAQKEILGKKFTIYGDEENPLFLAKDIAEWIEYPFVSKTKKIRNVSQMVRMVDDDEKLRNNVTTTSKLNNVTTTSKVRNTQESWFLTEDGLYEVLMQSRKPIAKAFKKEVKIILKSIRKHCMYATAPTIDEMLDDPQIMIKALQKLDKERKERDTTYTSLNL